MIKLSILISIAGAIIAIHQELSPCEVFMNTILFFLGSYVIFQSTALLIALLCPKLKEYPQNKKFEKENNKRDAS